MEKKNIAIIGATGLVGETLRAILEEREFPVGNVAFAASPRSVGKTIVFQGNQHTVCAIDDIDFKQFDIAFFMAGKSISTDYVPKVAAQGCLVIDNSSAFRYDENVPLVVPEVNPEKIRAAQSNIIANPNCSTLQLVVALKPIYDAVGVERINIATYQALSGAGRHAMDELQKETTDIVRGQPVSPELYPYPMAFNVIPKIDSWEDNGYTREEMKIVWETQKILGDPNIRVNATAVRVPVMNGHSEAVHIETTKKLTAEEARALLMQAPGIQVIDDVSQAKAYPTAVSPASGADPVYVGRIREDISHPNGLNLWVVADNIRKGAALNAIQIAESL